MGHLYLAFVADIDTVFSAATHATTANDGFVFTFSHAEGQAAQCTVERAQLGWMIMAPDAPRFVLISETTTDDPLDAVLIARGRIDGLPSGLFTRTQKISIICAPGNLLFAHLTQVPGDIVVDGPVMVYARANLAGAPEFCPYYSDCDVDRPESYLLGRAQAYYVDPATHEISVSDLADGDVIDMADKHQHDDKVRPTDAFQPDTPVPQARLKVRAPWTQTAQGLCNIADRIVGDGYSGWPTTQVVSTLSPDFLTYSASDAPSGLGNMLKGAGWTLETTNSRVRSTPALPAPGISSGRRIQIVYDEHDEGTGIHLGQFQKTHDEMIYMSAWVHRFDQVLMRYEYSQEREEAIYVVLEEPIQTPVQVDYQVDLGEVTLKDLTTDPTIPPYQTGDYVAGDKVIYGGLTYQCTADHTSTGFFQQTPDLLFWPTATVPADFSFHPYWVQIANGAPMKPTDYGLSDTDAGVGIIAHAVLRCRKALVTRNRTWKITLKYSWADASAITLKNSLRVEVPWISDGSTRIIVGKVVQIDRQWDGKSGPTASVTIAVSIGTGATDTTEAGLTATYTSSDDYFPDGYLAVTDGTHGVAGDTTFLISPDPINRPIVAEWLDNPMYAVDQIYLENEASKQIAAIIASTPWQHPGIVVQNNPTRLQVNMRDLASEGLITRNIVVAAQMLTAPRGIDLVAGGEP